MREQTQETSREPRATSHGRAAALALAAALLLAACDYFGFTPVKDIAATPAQFEGKEVKIKGKVSEPIQLFNLRTFRLTDETGEILVSTSGALPATGADVAVKGTVRSTVIVGGRSLGLRVEETQRLR